jgi:hypothetical protein
MAPAPNEVTRLVLLVVLILLGALLPVLLLHALNLQGARFTAPNRLRAIEIPVEISRGGRLRRRGEEGEVEPTLDRGQSLHAHGTRAVRELELGAVKLEAVASGSFQDRTFDLFRGPYGVARADGRRLVAGSNQPLRSWRGGTAQEVSLALFGTWILRIDGVRPAAEGPPADAYAVAAESAAPAAEGDFFAGSPPREAAEPAEAPRGPREPTIEGQLVLLTSDGPPVDQAKVLFAEAEQALQDADDLWEVERPEPESAVAEPNEEPLEAPADPVDAPQAAPPRSREWTPDSTPRKQPRDEGNRGDGDFF